MIQPAGGTNPSISYSSLVLHLFSSPPSPGFFQRRKTSAGWVCFHHSCNALLCFFFFFFVSIVSSASSSHKVLVYIFGRAIWSQRACGLWEHSLRQEHKHCDVPIPSASLSQWEFCYGIIQHACLQYMHTKSLFISKLFSFDCTAADVLIQTLAIDWVYYVRVFCYVMGVFSDQFSDQWQNCSASASWPLSPFCLHLVTHSPVCSQAINCPLIWNILISILIEMWLKYLSY